MIRSIFYTTDLESYAPYVLQRALSLTRVYNAELYVVYVVGPLGLFAESVLQTYLDTERLQDLRVQGLDNVMESIGRRILKGFRDELGELPRSATLVESVRVVQGDPPQMILDEAERLTVDLIVAGSHSHGTQLDTPLDWTAARLVQLAEVPVYLVPMLRHRNRDLQASGRLMKKRAKSKKASNFIPQAVNMAIYLRFLIAGHDNLFEEFP